MKGSGLAPAAAMAAVRQEWRDLDEAQKAAFKDDAAAAAAAAAAAEAEDTPGAAVEVAAAAASGAKKARGRKAVAVSAGAGAAKRPAAASKKKAPKKKKKPTAGGAARGGRAAAVKVARVEVEAAALKPKSNPWLEFVSHRRAAVLEANPGARASQVLSLLGQEWRQLSDTEREAFRAPQQDLPLPLPGPG